MIFWTEASKRIGTGHLMECLAIAGLFQKQKIPFHFIINPYPPAEKMLCSKDISYDVLPISDVDAVCKKVKRYSKNNCVIIDHRNLKLASLKKLRKESFKIVIIDQLGNKKIIGDLLINGSIVPEWLKYNFIGAAPACCFGADFAIVREEFLYARRKNRDFSRKEKTILVSMGGVDRTGATIRVLRSLKGIKQCVNNEIILGAGFVHPERFKRVREELNVPQLKYSQGVNDMADRMQKADIAISAGGNSLYEMACVGTPGLVLWEDSHENRQGLAFSEKGAVVNLGNGMRTPILKIRDALRELLNNTEKLAAMSKCGMKLVDGRGVNRIVEAIIALTMGL